MDLPFEILAHEIFPLLSSKDVISCSKLSKRWLATISGRIFLPKWTTNHCGREMAKLYRLMTKEGVRFFSAVKSLIEIVGNPTIHTAQQMLFNYAEQCYQDAVDYLCGLNIGHVVVPSSTNIIVLYPFLRQLTEKLKGEVSPDEQDITKWYLLSKIFGMEYLVDYIVRKIGIDSCPWVFQAYKSSIKKVDDNEEADFLPTSTVLNRLHKPASSFTYLKAAIYWFTNDSFKKTIAEDPNERPIRAIDEVVEDPARIFREDGINWSKTFFMYLSWKIIRLEYKSGLPRNNISRAVSTYESVDIDGNRYFEKFWGPIVQYLKLDEVMRLSIPDKPQFLATRELEVYKYWISKLSPSNNPIQHFLKRASLVQNLTPQEYLQDLEHLVEINVLSKENVALVIKRAIEYSKDDNWYYALLYYSKSNEFDLYDDNDDLPDLIPYL